MDDRREGGAVCRQRRAIIMASVIGVLALASTTLASAATAFPTKSVTLIVPFTAGGTTDIVGRLVAQKLTQMWGQSVVVDNRPGAGGNIGGALVAKAAPDGYTILLTSGSVVTVNPYLYREMGFDVKKDLAAVTNIATGPMVVVVNPKVPANSLKELIALARAQPGKLNFGSAGQGSQVHMAGESFADAAGIQVQHVPYKGEALAYNDLIGGQIQLVVGNIAAASAFVNSGQLRALAVTSKERSAQLPDVPAAAEVLPGFENAGWFGLMAPAGTPPEVIEKIYRDSAKVLLSEEFRGKLTQQGMMPVANSPADFGAAIREESARWAKVVQQRGLKAN